MDVDLIEDRVFLSKVRSQLNEKNFASVNQLMQHFFVQPDAHDYISLVRAFRGGHGQLLRQRIRAFADSLDEPVRSEVLQEIRELMVDQGCLVDARKVCKLLGSPLTDSELLHIKKIHVGRGIIIDSYQFSSQLSADKLETELKLRIDSAMVDGALEVAEELGRALASSELEKLLQAVSKRSGFDEVQRVATMRNCPLTPSELVVLLKQYARHSGFREDFQKVVKLLPNEVVSETLFRVVMNEMLQFDWFSLRHFSAHEGSAAERLLPYIHEPYRTDQLRQRLSKLINSTTVNGAKVIYIVQLLGDRYDINDFERHYEQLLKKKQDELILMLVKMLPERIRSVYYERFFNERKHTHAFDMGTWQSYVNRPFTSEELSHNFNSCVEAENLDWAESTARLIPEQEDRNAKLVMLMIRKSSTSQRNAC